MQLLIQQLQQVKFNLRLNSILILPFLSPELVSSKSVFLKVSLLELSQVILNSGLLNLNKIGTTCQVLDASGVYQNAQSCTNSGNKITLVFPNAVSFPLGFVRKFRLQNNLITAPTTNSTYLFDITSYLTDGTTVIESWTDYVIVAPAPWTATPTGTTLERYPGRTTVLTFSMTTQVKVPAGVNQYKSTDTKGFLEFEFTNTATDLGLGYTTATSIPCYANSGLVPSNIFWLS